MVDCWRSGNQAGRTATERRERPRDVRMEEAPADGESEISFFDRASSGTHNGAVAEQWISRWSHVCSLLEGAGPVGPSGESIRMEENAAASVLV